MTIDDGDRVVPLGQLDDFTVAEGDPDVRGWEVLAADGRKVGEVDELLVDTRAMKVRYLDVDVDGEAGARDGLHVLVPIGYARLDRERTRVLVDELASDDLRGVPAYDQGPLTREYERSVRRSFRDEAPAEGDFYAGGAFDDDRFYGRRRVGDARTPAERLDDDWGTRRVGQVGDL